MAPEAVRTFRTNGLTPPPYNHPLVPRTHHPDRTTPTKNPHHDATSPKLARVRFDSLANATSFIRTIQYRQGLNIGCPEEIAWRMGFIDDDGLRERAEPLVKSGYGQYLLDILARERR